MEPYGCQPYLIGTIGSVSGTDSSVIVPALTLKIMKNQSVETQAVDASGRLLFSYAECLELR